MAFWKRLFGGESSDELRSEESRVSVDEIVDLISNRASTFRGGRGMVLVLQEGLRIQIFFLNGIPTCSWNYTNHQLSLDRVGETFLERPPVVLALRERDMARLAPLLQSRFSHCDTGVQPLWHLDRNAWDYEVMRSLHEHDVGVRISFQ